MATPSATSQVSANAVVDEAVRLTTEGARRTTQTASAALQQTRSYFDHATEINRGLFALWSESVDAWFQTVFDAQNATFSIGKTSFGRYAELMQKAQATSLKTYQVGAQFVSGALLSSE